MKKYVKPTIVYENYELSRSIANCSPAMNHSKESCTYDSSELPEFLNAGETVFYENNCSISYEEFMSMFEDFCLQTDTDNYNLFTS